MLDVCAKVVNKKLLSTRVEMFHHQISKTLNTLVPQIAFAPMLPRPVGARIPPRDFPSQVLRLSVHPMVANTQIDHYWIAEKSKPTISVWHVSPIQAAHMLPPVGVAVHLHLFFTHPNPPDLMRTRPRQELTRSLRQALVMETFRMLLLQN